MTSMAVKGVGNVLNNLTTNAASQAAAQSKAGTMSFQSVWNSQAGKGGSSQASQPDRTASQKQSAKAGESLRSKNADKVKNAEADGSDVEEQGEGLSQDDKIQRAMEVLGTAAMELISQITDTLGISGEELQGLLDQMGMEAVDLLDGENLSAFLLQAFGVEDSVALLTDENMYADYKQLMGELDRMLKEESGSDAMTLADAYDLAGQSLKGLGEEESALAQEKPLESLIQVTVEKPEDELDGEPVETQPADVQPDAPKSTEQADHSKERHSDSREHSDHGQNAGNPFLQNLQQLDPSLQSSQTAEVSGGFDVDTQDIMRQIMDYMKLQVRPGMSDLEMQLHPANLGTLQIHVAAKGGVVTANFIAQNEAVKAALESQMVQLKENFAQQGVRVEAIEVTVQTHEFEQNLEQGRERGQEQTAAKSQRTRRIRLDGLAGSEEIEELPSEDQLTAQMMAANGSTVDFTA